MKLSENEMVYFINNYKIVFNMSSRFSNVTSNCIVERCNVTAYIPALNIYTVSDCKAEIKLLSPFS